MFFKTFFPPLNFYFKYIQYWPILLKFIYIYFIGTNFFRYPALLVMPSSISDDSIRRFSRCYRHGRVPAITWRHNRTKALLLRGASYHDKRVMSLFKTHHPYQPGHNLCVLHILYWLLILYFSYQIYNFKLTDLTKI